MGVIATVRNTCVGRERGMGSVSVGMTVWVCV